MTKIVLVSPTTVPPADSVTIEITAEAETWASFTTNPTGKRSVMQVKAAFALLYTVIKSIPAVSPPLVQTPESIIAGLAPLMAASVALAEAAPDFA